MKRFYRSWINKDGYESFQVQIKESDLFIVCDKNLKQISYDALKRVRQDLEGYTAKDPLFKSALKPYTPMPDAPEIIHNMAAAAELYNVGPMAAVAGAVAQYLGRELDPHCSYLMIENGGDIYLKSSHPVLIQVWLPDTSLFAGRLNFSIDPQGESISICTSSGTFGHSLSFGKADAVAVTAKDACIADAAATALGNKAGKYSIEEIINAEKDRGFLQGIIIAHEKNLGIWGDMEIMG